MNIFTKHKISAKKTVGRVLTYARKKQNITLEKAELETKVRIKYLQSLEQDDFAKMPADVYNIGFLTRYADYLKLNSKKILAQYLEEKSLYINLNKRRDFFKPDKNSSINPGNPENYRERLKFVFTPQTIISFLIIIITIGVIAYVWLQVKSFAAAPPLELKNPAQEIMVSIQNVNVEGQTDSTAELFINNQAVAIEPSGHFREEVQLVNGMNNIEIKAINKSGKKTIKTIQVLATDQK